MDFASMKVKEINDLFKSSTHEEHLTYIDALLSDDRNSINKLGQKVSKEIDKRNAIIEKFETMSEFEKPFWENSKLVAGLDEVGRGPLFGSVVTACVILDENVKIYGLDDSKKIKESERERLYDEIMAKAKCVSIGMCDNDEIDDINILNATKLAMMKAIALMDITPEHLLIDALLLPEVDIEQTSIIKGDTKSVSIAAASIIAKVTRDRMMIELDKEYPEYDFKNNKGYGTASHYAGIEKVGITKYHRKSFLKNII